MKIEPDDLKLAYRTGERIGFERGNDAANLGVFVVGCIVGALLACVVLLS